MIRVASGFISFTLLLLVSVGCGNSEPDGLHKSGSTPARSSAIPETPAPIQSVGKSFVYNFDTDPAGRLAAKFHAALTGRGSEGEWVVQADDTAPSQPNVLAQLSADKTDYRFPLAIADEGSFLDLDLSVEFKAVSGEVDRAAGM